MDRDVIYIASVADLTETRLKKLQAERSAAAARLAEIDARIADFCRKWSAANGYAVVLRAEQVARAIEAGKETA